MHDDNKLSSLIARVMKQAGIENVNVTARTEEEYTQWKCDTYNNDTGNLNETDGYNCDKCKNKGFIAYPKYEEQFGYWNEVQKECECQKIRKMILRLAKSGLKNIIRDYTFANYEVSEDWQNTVKNAAMKYAKESENAWFFIGGQVGSGKSHLCTAIAGHYLKKGKDVKYMIWRDEVVKIKRVINDAEYEDIINEYKRASVLYIDDLFKPSKSTGDDIQRPTASDVQIAFEILNYRYNNKNLITIISSERDINQLIDIDEALASRITEMSFQKGFGLNIAKDRNKNYRLRGIISI